MLNRVSPLCLASIEPPHYCLIRVRCNPDLSAGKDQLKRWNTELVANLTQTWGEGGSPLINTTLKPPTSRDVQIFPNGKKMTIKKRKKHNGCGT